MDASSKIPAFSKLPTGADQEVPEKKFSQTKNPTKNYCADAKTHVQSQSDGEVTKSIKDQNISSNIFDSSGIPTILYELRQSDFEQPESEGQPDQTPDQTAATGVTKGKASIGPAKALNSGIFDSSGIPTILSEVRQSDFEQPESKDQLGQAPGQTAATGVTKKASIGPAKTLNSGNQVSSPATSIPKTVIQAPGHTYPKPKEIKDLSKFKFDNQNYKDNYLAVSQEGKDLGKQFQLTMEEVGAIRAYTGDSYKYINWQMRNLPDPLVDLYDAQALENSGVRSDMAKLIANLVSGLEKLPSAQSSTTHFEGLGRDTNLPAAELAKYKQGAIVSTPMFTSTTTKLGQLADMDWWTKFPQTIIIHQRPNGNGRNIGPFSAISKESEILFLPNTRFGVNSVKENVKVGGPINWSQMHNLNEDQINAAYNAPMIEELSKTVIALQELPPKQPAQPKPKEKTSLFTSSIRGF